MSDHFWVQNVNAKQIVKNTQKVYASIFKDDLNVSKNIIQY